MARPRKCTVDYFPHVTTHGKTMFVLEQRFGNDGYAVFFKVLETLGNADGHYINCNDLNAWVFLAAYCRVDVSLLREILELCAELGAINREFWADNFIYSENFVDGIKDAYRQRKVAIPTLSGVSTVINSYKATLPQVSTVINPQMKVNEMKLDENKSSSSTDQVLTDDIEKPMKMMINEFRIRYNETFNKVMPGTLNHDADQLCRRYPRETIEAAFQITAQNNGESFAYLKAVLTNQPKGDSLEAIIAAL